MRKLINIFGMTLFVIAFVNFTVFWIVAGRIGGDAMSGKIENGHYYLCNHGKYTEVTPSVWHYSRAHIISTWITHPLAILGFGLIALSERTKKTAKPIATPDQDGRIV